MYFQQMPESLDFASLKKVVPRFSSHFRLWALQEVLGGCGQGRENGPHVNRSVVGRHVSGRSLGQCTPGAGDGAHPRDVPNLVQYIIGAQ